MTKQQAVKSLKQTLTFGNREVTKSVNETTYKMRLLVVCEMVLERITGGMLAHDEYWTAAYGVKWMVQTGRANLMYCDLGKMDMQQCLNFIEDVKRNAQTVSEVETYLNQLYISKKLHNGA